MDAGERQRLKQLANDAVIDNFGHDGIPARLAVALEQCVDELEERDDRCPVCSVCPDHGDHDDESIEVDASEVLEAHKGLKERLAALKDCHVRLSGVVIDIDDADGSVEQLAELIESLEEDIDSVEACVIP